LSGRNHHLAIVSAYSLPCQATGWNPFVGLTLIVRESRELTDS
jgi:hypothetical protein